MTPLMRIEEPPRPSVPGFALWQLGFRPFYLLASAFAVLSIGLWALQFAGMPGPAYLQGPLWHAHEMLFGFALAVIVGFLLTAGRNWSNQPTWSGAPLVALAALWVAGRLLVLTPHGGWAALVNVAFPLAAAVALAIPFLAARNRRNYFFVGLLLLMAGAQGVFHLAQLGVIRVPGWLGIQLALDVVLFIMAVMGGRVIPMFTQNGVPGSRPLRKPWVERAALGSVLALAVADVAQQAGAPTAWLTVAVAVLAAAAHALRWALWQPWTTRHTPLVWVLHAGYLWIPVHLALRAAAAAGAVAPSLATHALTVGAIGGLVIGMMTRTARGHTARPLRAGRAEVLSYLLVLAAALVRVAVPLLVPDRLVDAVLWSAACWCAGFALYAVTYWPVLTRARLDGKPG